MSDDVGLQLPLTLALSHQGLTTRQFYGSKGRSRLIPSLEGWPKAGVGFPGLACTTEPTPPLRGTPPKRGFPDALPLDSRSLQNCRVLSPPGAREYQGSPAYQAPGGR